MRKTRLLRATFLAVACSLSMAVSAQSGVPKAIDIPPGDLVSNLQALTRPSGADVVYRADLLAGLRTQAVRGTMTADHARDQLLTGSRSAVQREQTCELQLTTSGPPRPWAHQQAT